MTELGKLKKNKSTIYYVTPSGSVYQYVFIEKRGKDILLREIQDTGPDFRLIELKASLCSVNREDAIERRIKKTISHSLGLESQININRELIEKLKQLKFSLFDE